MMANRNFRDGKDFEDKALLYQMTRLQVRKEPMRVIDSEFMLFLEPEGFYTYGFFWGAQGVLCRLECTFKSIFKIWYTKLYEYFCFTYKVYKHQINICWMD